MSNSSNKRKRKLRNQHRSVKVINPVSSPQKGNGLSRADQVTFGLKIEVLIGEELKFFANVDYQAPQDGLSLIHI